MSSWTPHFIQSHFPTKGAGIYYTSSKNDKQYHGINIIQAYSIFKCIGALVAQVAEHEAIIAQTEKMYSLRAM